MTIARWRDRFAALGRNLWRVARAFYAVPYLIEFILAALILCGALACGGCAKQRGQYASDNRARLEAAHMNVFEAIAWLAQMRDQAKAAGHDDVAQSFAQVHDRLANGLILIDRAHDAEPAVAEVPSQEMPAPARDPKTLANDASQDGPVPPEPTNHLGMILGIGTTVLSGTLLILGRIAPLTFPGFGSIVGALANAGWAAMAHGDQKAADRTQTAIVGAAQQVAPILDVLQQLPPDALPAALRPLVTPDRLNAAQVIVGMVAASAAPAAKV